MSTPQINITLGTAGHIDHGKTALIKCLTGCDTDRLKAEKERGMSIDLGFAPCLISDMEVGIVDVPGHENFIKTMVAGATSIDGAIFVIAADDGVMPQTREHLDILALLGVRKGIIALTKADCVEPDRLSGVTTEVESFLVGTFLEGAPVVAVSSITGEGFGDLLDALKELVGSIEPKRVDGLFRMPVERTFSLKGYGTVVTGIPVSGRAGIGDEVVVYPQGAKGRIRAVQVYSRDSDSAVSGQCAAINVPQWDYGAIKRGDVVTEGGVFSPRQWYLCDLVVLGSSRTTLKNGAGVKFHTGTSEVAGTVYLMEGNSVSAGQRSVAQIRLNEPVVAGPGDHFILRIPSPAQTVGGGVIVEAIERRLKRSSGAVLDDALARAAAVGAQEDFVEYCVKSAQTAAVDGSPVAERAKLPVELAAKILSDLAAEGKIESLAKGLYVHRDAAAQTGERIVERIGDYHGRKPQSPGMSADEIIAEIGAGREVFDHVASKLVADGRVVERKHRYALPEHSAEYSDEQRKQFEAVESVFRSAGFSPPGLDEVVAQSGLSRAEVEKIVSALLERERLVQVSHELIFHADAVEQAREAIVAFINKEGRLESVKFKYLLDTTRKYAIPLLDYFDRTGVTRREGYTRYLKNAARPR